MVIVKPLTLQIIKILRKGKGQDPSFSISAENIYIDIEVNIRRIRSVLAALKRRGYVDSFYTDGEKALQYTLTSEGLNTTFSLPKPTNLTDLSHRVLMELEQPKNFPDLLKDLGIIEEELELQLELLKNKRKIKSEGELYVKC